MNLTAALSKFDTFAHNLLHAASRLNYSEGQAVSLAAEAVRAEIRRALTNPRGVAARVLAVSAEDLAAATDAEIADAVADELAGRAMKAARATAPTFPGRSPKYHRSAAAEKSYHAARRAEWAAAVAAAR
jgi:hypothetical protein